ADYPDSDRDRREELRLLARHGAADAEHGALLPAQHRAASSEGRAGWRAVLHRKCGHRPARQGSVRRALRALPFEQAARSPIRDRSGECERTRLSDEVERLLELDED